MSNGLFIIPLIRSSIVFGSSIVGSGLTTGLTVIMTSSGLLTILSSLVIVSGIKGRFV